MSASDDFLENGYRFTDLSAIVRIAATTRESLTEAFGPDTAQDGDMWTNATYKGISPSFGHSMCVALINWALFGAHIIKGSVAGRPHTWNRVTTSDGKAYDLDMTGDQFGFPAVQIMPHGALYGRGVRQNINHARQQPLYRAIRLAGRAGLVYGADRLIARYEGSE